MNGLTLLVVLKTEFLLKILVKYFRFHLRYFPKQRKVLINSEAEEVKNNKSHLLKLRFSQLSQNYIFGVKSAEV